MKANLPNLIKGKKIRKFIKQLSLRSLVSIMSLSLALNIDVIHANPENPQVVSGSATFNQSQSTLTVNQISDKAIINWQSFSINSNEATHFNQPSTSAIALNRVTGNDPSKIFGTLTANGQIVLLNQNGIWFGPGSVVNVAGLLATTANINDNDFLIGYYKFVQNPNKNFGILNEGTITVANQGLVALVAPGVENRGVIYATLGKVILASGKEFTVVDTYGDNLIQFAPNSDITNTPIAPDGSPMRDAVKNSGAIYADGGKVVMTAHAAANVVENVVNMNGVVQANSVVQRNGEIILSGGNEGVVRVAGKIKARGVVVNKKGGKIQVTGKYVGLFANTEIDASGIAGGGEILIGGDYQGKNSNVFNATATYIDSNASVKADALENGDGGKVIVWADDYTNYAGFISARGGNTSGNGGFVEVSGKKILDFRGTADLTALKGNAGTLLLDPADLTITNANANVTGTSPFQPTAGSATLNVSTLTTALASGNVTVQTGNDAFAGNGDITINSNISWSSGNSLTLSAYRNITSASNITNTGGGSVILRADNTGTGVGTVSFNVGRAVTLSGGSGSVNVYYNPTTFGTQQTIYTGGTTPFRYMLINSLGAATDSSATTNTRSLATVANSSTYWGQNFALAKSIDATATSA